MSEATNNRAKAPVDARGATGVQVGEGNTQIIYTYSGLTWSDGVAPPPLVAVSGMVESPYRGLISFDERDAAFFFGREAITTAVLERMSRQLDGVGLLAASGVSGAGKSSLLRAGVLPRMRGAGLAGAPGSERWPCLMFTPGHAPLDELAMAVGSVAGLDAASVRRGLVADPAGFALIARQAVMAQGGASASHLLDPGSRREPRLLLVVDQFEQLFTQCANDEQRQAFVSALLAAAAPVPRQSPAVLVILGVRADFEGRCADYPDQQLGNPMTGSTNGTEAVAFGPDGDTLVSGDDDGVVRLWNVTRGRQIGASFADGATGLDASVTFSPDGKTLATASPDSLRLWSVATREQIGDPLPPSDAETPEIDGAAPVAFSPDGATVAGIEPGTSSVGLWTVTTHRQVGEPLTTQANTLYSLAFSPNAKLLATGEADDKTGSVQVWDLATHRLVWHTSIPGTIAVDSVAFSQNSATLAAGGDDGLVDLLNATTGREIGNWRAGNADSGVNSVAFSPDGKTIATGSDDDTARLWDVASRHQIGNPLAGSGRPVESVVFSPDGATLATNGIDLWDVATQEQIGDQIDANSDIVSSVAFSPDGKTIASADEDGTARLWDVSELQNVIPQLCASAGRSLTRTEWKKYVPPGADYRNLCP